jgi:hypothetical protein
VIERTRRAAHAGVGERDCLAGARIQAEQPRLLVSAGVAREHERVGLARPELSTAHRLGVVGELAQRSERGVDGMQLHRVPRACRNDDLASNRMPRRDRARPELGVRRECSHQRCGNRRHAAHLQMRVRRDGVVVGEGRRNGGEACRRERDGEKQNARHRRGRAGAAARAVRIVRL